MTIVAACQVFEQIGNVDANIATLIDYSQRAEEKSAELICFPECHLQGYEIEIGFIERNALDRHSTAFDTILKLLSGLNIIIVFGFIERKESAFYNSAAIVQKGKLIGVYRKQFLMRSEEKNFSIDNEQPIFFVNGLKFSVAICKDLNLESVYKIPKNAGANLLVAPCNNMLKTTNAYIWQHKHNQIRQENCKNAKIALLSSDVTGKRSDYVALGPTAYIDATGTIRQQIPSGSADLLCATLRE